MPQSVFNHSDNGLTRSTDCNLINPPSMIIGSGSCTSYVFSHYSIVYNYECYGGTPLCHSWCLTTEVQFGRLMAFAAAIRWDMESGSD